MSRHGRSTWVAAAAALAVAGYVLVPEAALGGWAVTAYKTALGVLAGAAVLAGAVRRRPPAPAAWVCFGLGITANALGALVSDVYIRVFQQAGYPNVADGFWLMLYPGLLLGIGLLIRARGSSRDWASSVDAMVVATGFGLLAWVFLMVPVTSDHTLGTIGQVIVLAYPVGDVMVVAMLLHLVLAGGVRRPAFWLICASVVLFLAGDVAWAALSQLGIELGPVPTRLLDLIFLLAYALFALAARHPSALDLGQPGRARPPRLSRGQILLLTGATMIAPGILAVQVARGRVTDGAAIVIGSVALFLLVVVRMVLLVRQVEEQARQLTELARFDSLTGLLNRRAWFDEVPPALAAARREQRPLTVAMLDLDHFKLFNDQFGHQAGDALLRGAAQAWAGRLRGGDGLARYGGEEFILLLPDTGTGSAVELLERLRAVTPSGQTFSAGVAVWDGTETSGELIGRADRALYAAKAAGRNRTERSGPARLAAPAVPG